MINACIHKKCGGRILAAVEGRGKDMFYICNKCYLVWQLHGNQQRLDDWRPITVKDFGYTCIKKMKIKFNLPQVENK
jgi:hypothetical protein